MTDIKQQLEKLEKRKLELLEKRKDEIMDLVIETKALSIDNKVLAGALLFIMDDANKKDPLLLKFKEMSKGIKMPSQRRKSKK